MNNLSPHSSPGDPPPMGWIAQLVALVWTVVLHRSWYPTLRLILIAIVAVALVLAMRSVG